MSNSNNNNAADQSSDGSAHSAVIRLSLVVAVALSALYIWL